jgi:hypothetical protein
MMHTATAACTYYFGYIGFMVSLGFHMGWNETVLNRYKSGHHNYLSIIKMPKSKKKSKMSNPARSLGRVSPYLTANIQPFSDHARGCKVPDDNMLPSVSATYKESNNLVIDANGFAARIYRADLNDYMVNSASITSGVVTWDTATVVAGTNITGKPDSSEWCCYRVVAAGIRLRYTSPVDTATGNVTVCQSCDLNGAAELSYTSWPQTGTENESAPGSFQISLSKLARNEITIPLKMVDHFGYDYKHMVTTRTTLGYDPGLHPTTGWSYASVFVNAGVSGAIIDVDYIIHVEMIPRLSNRDPLLTPVSSLSENSEMLALARKLTGGFTDQLIHYGDKHENHVKSTLSKYIDKGLSIGKNMIVSGVGAVASKAVPLLEDILPYAAMFL